MTQHNKNAGGCRVCASLDPTYVLRARRMRPSPLGEKVPVVSKTRLRHEGRMRGPSLLSRQVAPHRFGQMTYGLAITVASVGHNAHEAVSHGLASSPPRGEGKGRRRPGMTADGRHPIQDRSEIGGVWRQSA